MIQDTIYLLTKLLSVTVSISVSLTVSLSLRPNKDLTTPYRGLWC